MKGISFPEQTTIFGKPETWKDEDCYGLPVNQGFYLNSDGKPEACLHSVWKLTDAEVDYVLKHKTVYLRTSGTGMPPVSVHVLNEIPSEEMEIIRGMILHAHGTFLEGDISKEDFYQGWVDALHTKQKHWAELKTNPNGTEKTGKVNSKKESGKS